MIVNTISTFVEAYNTWYNKQGVRKDTNRLTIMTEGQAKMLISIEEFRGNSIGSDMQENKLNSSDLEAPFERWTYKKTLESVLPFEELMKLKNT
jgi:hypothetical protein